MPRLRPRPLTVLRRPGGGVQVGLDVEGAFVVSGVSDDAVGVLTALTAGYGAEEMPHLVPTADAVWTEAFLWSLATQGLLEAPRTPLVEIWGAGELADRVACLLDEERTAVRRRPEPAHDDVPAPGGPERLVVLCPTSAEPDRILTTALAHGGQPHLVVRAETERAVVGPLVLPGRTACVRCTDLVRRDLDPDWPSLLVQLSHQAPRRDPVLGAWAAATAAAQVRAWASGAPAEATVSTCELDAASGQVVVRRWPTHHECGCARAPAQPR